MFQKINAKNLGYIENDSFGMAYLNCDIEMPKECPRCKRAVVPQILDSYMLKYPEEEIAELTTMFFCRGCEKVFLGNYIGNYEEYKSHNRMELQYLSPYSETITSFSEEIYKLSPEFVDIYNQAEKAENVGLDKICGIAYRKALEYLVKDFSIRANSSNEEKIKSTPLGKCINEYITSEKLKALAKAATWIGNDETHYVKKYENYSFQEMKAFLKAMVSYIDSELQVLEAEELVYSKK